MFDDSISNDPDVQDVIKSIDNTPEYTGFQPFEGIGDITHDAHEPSTIGLAWDAFSGGFMANPDVTASVMGVLPDNIVAPGAEEGIARFVQGAGAAAPILAEGLMQAAHNMHGSEPMPIEGVHLYRNEHGDLVPFDSFSNENEQNKSEEQGSNIETEQQLEASNQTTQQAAQEQLTQPQTEQSQNTPQPEQSQNTPQPEQNQAAPQPQQNQAAPQPEQSQAAPQPQQSQTAPQSNNNDYDYYSGPGY